MDSKETDWLIDFGSFVFVDFIYICRQISKLLFKNIIGYVYVVLLLCRIV